MVAAIQPEFRARTRKRASLRPRCRPCVRESGYPRFSPAGLGLRFYSPGLHVWTVRDAASVFDVADVYTFAKNAQTWTIDPLGHVPFFAPSVRTTKSIQAIVGAPMDDSYGPITAAGVVAYQNMLRDYGFDPGPSDGKWGQGTENAYQAYLNALKHKGPGNLRTFLSLKDKQNKRTCKRTSDVVVVAKALKAEWEEVDGFESQAVAWFGGTRASTIAQLNTKVQPALGTDGILHLTQAAHATLARISIGSGSSGPVDESKRDLVESNRKVWEPIYNYNKFCCGCQIWLVSCGLAKGTFPQIIANRSGCKTYAYDNCPSNWHRKPW